MLQKCWLWVCVKIDFYSQNIIDLTENRRPVSQKLVWSIVVFLNIVPNLPVCIVVQERSEKMLFRIYELPRKWELMDR